MSSDFANAGKASLQTIPVPPISMDAIYARARDRRSRTSLRRVALGPMLAVGVLGAATIAAVKSGGIDLWIRGNKGALMIHSVEVIRSPHAAEFHAAVAKAIFPVVYPVALPHGAKIVEMIVAPKSAPTSVTLEYRGANGFHAQFLIADATIVNAAKFGPGSAQPRFGRVDAWHVGGEIVVVPRGMLSTAEVDRIKSAMLKSSPTASAADAVARLLPFVVLGGLDRVMTADRLAPATGSTVLIDDAQVRYLPQRIASRAPFVDNRIQSITGVTYKNGMPQFGQGIMARTVSPKNVEIDLNGMKAIEATLRAHGMQRCRCDVLFHRGVRSYTIWTLPQGHAKVEKYRVPAQ